MFSYFSKDTELEVYFIFALFNFWKESFSVVFVPSEFLWFLAFLSV